MALRLTGKRQLSQKSTKELRATSKPPSAVEVLTGEILQLVGATQAEAVAARAEVGRRLARVKDALSHGAWLPWLVAHMPLSAASAKRAMQLHQFRESQPEVFAKLAPLGLTKAYALIALAPKERDAFVENRHVVPSTGNAKAPLEMTFGEMMEVLHPPAPETPTSTRTRVLRGLRRQTEGLARLLSSLQASAPRAVVIAPVRTALKRLTEELQVVASVLASKSLIAGRVPRFQ